MNKKLILLASLVCAPVFAKASSGRLPSPTYWNRVKLACACCARTITSPFRLLWNKLFGKPYKPLTVKPHRPVTFADATRTVRIEGIETLKQTVADCGPRAALNCSFMYLLLTHGHNPAAKTMLINEELINAALDVLKRRVASSMEVNDQSAAGVWYDEYQIGKALKFAQGSNEKYAGPNDAKGIAFYDWEQKQFRLRTVDGDLVKDHEDAIRAMKKPGIHQVVICENAHYRALVIHRTQTSTTYYYADSYGASTPWKLPTFRTIFTTLEADHPEIVEEFLKL